MGVGGPGGEGLGSEPDPPRQGKPKAGIWFDEEGAIQMEPEFIGALEKSYPKLNIFSIQTQASNWHKAAPKSARKKNALRFFTNWINRDQAKMDRFDKIRGSTGGAKGRYNTSSRNLEAAKERQKRFEAEEAEKRRLLEDGKTTKQPDE